MRELLKYDVDIKAGTATVLEGDASRTIAAPQLAAIATATAIEFVSVDTAAREAILRLAGGIEARVELGAGRSASQQLAGRTVVYLDQNHWSTVARWRSDNGAVRPGDAAAARRLGELVEAGQIVLPYSGGHLLESTRLYGERRVRLAGAILDLSRGWQMTHPVHVRLQEFRRALLREEPYTAQGVFSISTADVLTSKLAAPSVATDLPAHVQAHQREMIRLLMLYDTIAETAAIPDEEGRAAAAGWAAKWGDAGKRMHAEGRTPHEIDGIAQDMLLADHAQELAQLGHELQQSVEAVVGTFTAAADPFDQMPYMSRLRDMTRKRLRNPGQAWTGNDLIDMNFLSCATGYADVVIAERQAVGYLKQAKLPTSGARPTRSLAEGVAIVESL